MPPRVGSWDGVFSCSALRVGGALGGVRLIKSPPCDGGRLPQGSPTACDPKDSFQLRGGGFSPQTPSSPKEEGRKQLGRGRMPAGAFPKSQSVLGLVFHARRRPSRTTPGLQADPAPSPPLSPSFTFAAQKTPGK